MPLVLIGLFVFLASIFNSIMDALENEPNYDESIFKHLDKKAWLKSESWRYCKTILGYHIDPWHLAKSLMVFCIIGAIIAAIWAGAIGGIKLSLIYVSGAVFVLGAIWDLTFTLFYHGIFKVK